MHAPIKATSPSERKTLGSFAREIQERPTINSRPFVDDPAARVHHRPVLMPKPHLGIVVNNRSIGS